MITHAISQAEADRVQRQVDRLLKRAVTLATQRQALEDRIRLVLGLRGVTDAQRTALRAAIGHP